VSQQSIITMRAAAEQPLWQVESQSAWIAPSSKLAIPVPVADDVKFLALEFQVLAGSCIDFDIMLENPEEDTAARLYGPTRRATSVRTVLPLPNAGIAHVTFDNISSWLTSVQIKYTLKMSAEEPSEQLTISRMRFGDMIGRDGRLAAQEAQEEEEEEEEARLALKDAKPCELKISPGTTEEVELRVDEATHMYVSVDVISGRDIDFGIMHVPHTTGGDEPAPTRLFGPCRRATNLSANVLVPSAGTVVLGFDNSGMWISSKKVRFRAKIQDQCVTSVTDL